MLEKNSFETEKEGLSTFLIEVKDIDPGMYFLRVTANNQISTTRILIQ